MEVNQVFTTDSIFTNQVQHVDVGKQRKAGKADLEVWLEDPAVMRPLV